MKIRHFILLLAVLTGAQLLKAEGPSRKARPATHALGFAACLDLPGDWTALSRGDVHIRREPEKRPDVVRIRFRAASSVFAIPLVWRNARPSLPGDLPVSPLHRPYNRLLLPSYYHFLYRLALF